jgi:PEP-CTERM motif
MLPSTVSIANSSVPSLSAIANELQQGFVFGSAFSFVLTISGDAVDHPNFGTESSTFALFLLDGNDNPLLTDPNNFAGGAVTTIDINPDGTRTVTTYPTMTGGPSVARVTQLVPEPSSMILSAIGLVVLGVGVGSRRLPASGRRTSGGPGFGPSGAGRKALAP